MKSSVLILALSCALAAEAATNGVALTREERLARRLAAVARNGGYVTPPVTGNVLRVVNRQKAVSPETIKKVAAELTNSFGMLIDITDGTGGQGVAGCTIEFTETPGDPVLLIAPEDKWGRLNVGRLTKDGPSALLLETRFTKEFWRVVAMTMGAANSNYKPSCLHNVFSLADLDDDPALIVCPEALDKVQKTVRELKLSRPRRVIYSQACREGWAPSPTSDVQRAIWEKIHAIPSTPLKIKYEKKK